MLLGNPLQCNCYTRPLKRWLRNQLVIPEDWREVKCFGPGYLEDQNLYNVSEIRLTCPKDYRVDGDQYDVTTDIKFRQFEVYVMHL